MVIAFEFIEGFLLVSAYYVRNILLRMAIPDTRLGPLVGELVADGLQKMRLAEPDSAVDEQRVVRSSRIFGDLDRSGARQLVGFAGHEAVERKRPVQTRALHNRRHFARTALCRLRRARGGIGSARQNQAHTEVATASLGGEPLDASDEALAHQFEHKAVGRGENQRVGASTGFRRKRPDPGIELLRGELLLESTQAGVPEVLHLVVGRVSSNFTFFGMSYPQPRARAAGKRNDLTMH